MKKKKKDTLYDWEYSRTEKVFSPWFQSLKINMVIIIKLIFPLKTIKFHTQIIIHQTYFPAKLPVSYELPTCHSLITIKGGSLIRKKHGWLT